MSFLHLNDVTTKEIVPGYHAKFVHSDTMTLAYWTIEAGAILPEHAHIHEQVANILEGQFELTVDGEKRVLEAGAVAVIPSNVRHAGRAITACKIIDVFSPVREEYRDK